MLGLVAAVVSGSVNLTKRAAHAREIREQVYAACSEAADYADCKMRWLDEHGEADPDREREGSQTTVIPMPVVVPR